MKKFILFAFLVLLAVVLLAQVQEQTQEPTATEPPAQSETQAQPRPQAQPQDKNLKKINFPAAFIHAGKEYPAGAYWLVLTAKEGQSLFAVQNAQKELLFEELAIVKARSGGRSGSGFRVGKDMTKGGEFFRIKVTTPGEWLLGYFLVKK